MVRTDVVDGGQCGGVHPFTGHPDAHPFQFVQVVVDVFRRVVRQERVTDSQRIEFGEEGFGPREKCRVRRAGSQRAGSSVLRVPAENSSL